MIIKYNLEILDLFDKDKKSFIKILKNWGLNYENNVYEQVYNNGVYIKAINLYRWDKVKIKTFKEVSKRYKIFSEDIDNYIEEFV